MKTFYSAIYLETPLEAPKWTVSMSEAGILGRGAVIMSKLSVTPLNACKEVMVLT